MSEIARALVLPDFFAPDPADLMSLLLVWEELEVEVGDYHPQWPDYKDFRDTLRDTGLIREYPPSFEIKPVVDPTIPDDQSGPELEQLAQSDGMELAAVVLRSIRKAQLQARDQGFAPVAMTQLAELASVLPPVDPQAPIAEATMIQVAVNGMRLDPATNLDDVLRFRERNRHLMGRFRGAMIDLSAAIDAGTAATAKEQAYAAMANRIEPVLGELAIALDRGRLSFAVNTLLGATALALGTADPTATAVTSGGLVAQSLKYAFDRDSLVRNHPYGLIYRAQQEFAKPVNAKSPLVITDPESTLAKTCFNLMLNLRLALRSPAG
ncbi:MAG TPA: hypothetical protein VIS95_07605 [Solirubrobacterales bacterium]